MATMRDVAQKANVSMSTVSYVINNKKNISEKVKEKVMKAIRELDYKPSKTAQSLARCSTKCIGLFVADIETIKTHIFFNELLAGILSVTSQRSFNVIVYPEQKNDKGEYCITLDHGEPIDGAIIINPRTANNYMEKIIEKDLSFVLIGRPDGIQDLINYVDTDNVAVGYNATKHLISCNHSKILFLNAPPNYTISIDRLEGYRIALKDYNIPFCEEMVVNSEFAITSSFEAVKQILQNNVKFTSIVANSDIHAIGAINALNEYNLKVPRDVSLICAGETFLTANYSPKITGIDINGYEIGVEAALQLLNILDKKLIKPSHNIIPFKINIRETTSNARL